MLNTRSTCQTVLVLLVLLIHGTWCKGATVTALKLVVDGSAEPPGDRIDFSVRFEPQEKEVDVSAKGFLIIGEGHRVTRPIGGQSVEGILARQKLVRDGEHLVKSGSVVIPYSAWTLKKGTHRIAYEFILTINNQVVFVRPTPLTEVVITEETRREMSIAETKVEDSIAKRTAVVRVAGEHSPDRPATPAMKMTSLETPVVKETTEIRMEAVEIPGEFFRKAIPVNSSPELIRREGVPETDAQSVASRWWRPSSEVKSDSERRIWFATNRTPDAEGKDHFAGKVDPQVRYGSCVVNIPIQNHRKGTLEMPSWWTKLDPEKHFVMQEVETFEKAEFAENFGEDDVLLFIHGFYNTFQDAIFRTAQLHHDLDFPGQSIAFSWPSAGSISEYESDQKNSDLSIDALIETITTLASTRKVHDGRRSKIHIIAHSMGNRILLQALYRINQSPGDYFDESPFGQVVLAAPDVGAIMFNNLSPHVVDLCEQVTYYFCETDAALNTSRQLNKYEPVGLLPYFDDGLFTINANGVGTSFIGHGYYASSREVLSDIELMLKHGIAPGERMPPLALETKIFGHKCWSFRETQVPEK